MSSPQGVSREQQPEIIRLIKGPVIKNLLEYWYCCKERTYFHGIIGGENFGRNTGSLCVYCDHVRCSKCKTGDDFIKFWRCCNTSVCHDALPNDVIMFSSSFFSQYWIVNDLDYGSCRLCGHERCDTCRYERYPYLKSHFNTMTLDSKLRREAPVATKDFTAVDKDEWERIITWTEAMEYQKAQKRRQAEIVIAMRYLVEAERKEAGKEELRETVEEIEPSVLESKPPSEIAEKIEESEPSVVESSVSYKVQGKGEDVDPSVVQSKNTDKQCMDEKYKDLVANKDENIPLRTLER